MKEYPAALIPRRRSAVRNREVVCNGTAGSILTREVGCHLVVLCRVNRPRQLHSIGSHLDIYIRESRNAVQRLLYFALLGRRRDVTSSSAALYRHAISRNPAACGGGCRRRLRSGVHAGNRQVIEQTAAAHQWLNCALHGSKVRRRSNRTGEKQLAIIFCDTNGRTRRQRRACRRRGWRGIRARCYTRTRGARNVLCRASGRGDTGSSDRELISYDC